jgi:zinc protease
MTQLPEIAITRPPVTPPLPPFHLPPVYQHTLGNGLRVFLVEDRRLPLVTLRLGFPGGAKCDPEDLPGLAEACAGLLPEGTTHRTAQELAEQLADIGGSLGASESQDAITLGATCLSENLGQLLELVADVARHANFPEDEVALYQQNRLQELLYQRSQPSVLADERMRRLIFGAHPYSRTLPTPDSIGRLGTSVLRAFRDQQLRPNEAVLVLLGHIPGEQATLELIEQWFGEWRAGEAFPQPDGEFPAPRRSIILVDRPGSVQADVRMGRLAVSRRHPQHLPLVLANILLGGGASSRLFHSIRETHGYAYSVGSSFDRYLGTGVVTVYEQVRNDVLADALKGTFAEMRRTISQPLEPGELNDIQNYASGTFVMGLETQGGLASHLSMVKLLDLADDYLETYTTRLRAVTPDQIQDVAGRYLNPDDAAIVVVGDSKSLLRQLESIGPVVVEPAEAEGEEVEP